MALNAEEQESYIFPDHDSLDVEDTFSILENNFIQLIGEMSDDPKMASYVEAYQSLFDYVYKMREKSLITKQSNRILNERLDISTEQLHKTHKVIIENSNHIESLHSRVSDCHMLLDEAHAREQFAHETIDNMRRTISRLEMDAQYNFDMDLIDNEETVKTAKSGIQGERDRLARQVGRLHVRLEMTIDHQHALEKKGEEDIVRIEEIDDNLEDAFRESNEYKSIIREQQYDLGWLKRECDQFDFAKEDLTLSLKHNTKCVLDLDKELSDQSTNITQCYKDLAKWNTKFYSLQAECDIAVDTMKVLRAENENIKINIRMADQAQEMVQKDLRVIVKNKMVSTNKVKLLEIETMHAVNDRNKLREKIYNINVSAEKVKLADYKRQLNNMLRSRNAIVSDLARQRRVVKANLDIIAQREQFYQKLTEEVQTHILEEQKQVKHIAFLQRERDRLKDETDERNYIQEDVVENVAVVRNKVLNQQNELLAQKIKWRALQNSYDAQISENATLNQYMLLISDKNKELCFAERQSKRKNRLLMQVTSQKEEEYLKSIAKTIALRDVTDIMIAQLNATQKKAHELREELSNRKSYERDLREVIDYITMHNRKLGCSIKTLINKINLIAQQMQRRNHELGLHYEKVDILKRAVECSSETYSKRVKDIKLLKFEIKRIRDKKIYLVTDISSMLDFKAEVFKLEKNLTRERLKSKMLEGEMGRSLNVHRWRQLEYYDPKAFKLLQKISSLQKQYVVCSDAIVERQAHLKVVRVLYYNLRKMAAKEPGPESLQILMRCKEKIWDSDALAKSFMASIKDKETTNRNCSKELQRVNQELHEVRCKLIEIHRWNNLRRKRT